MRNITHHDLNSTRNATWTIKSTCKYGEARGFYCRGDKFEQNSGATGVRVSLNRERWRSLVNILINFYITLRKYFLTGCESVRF